QKLTTLKITPLERKYSDNMNLLKSKNLPEHHSILLLPEKKFDTLKYNEAVDSISEMTDISVDKIKMIAPEYRIANKKNDVLCSDPHTKVFVIKEELSGYVKTKDDFDNFYKLASTGHNLLEKTASHGQDIVVECVDRKQKLFNIAISYRDSDKRFMNARKQYLNRISEGKLKAVLYILKFNGSTVKEIVYKAKNEPRAIYPLPMECTSDDIKKIDGGNTVNISAKNVQRTVNKLIEPSNLANNVATGIITGLAADSLSGFAKTQKGFEAFNFMKKLANESEALSAQFEKLAAEHESEEYLEYAKLMAVSYHLAEKTATVITDTNNVYPDIIPVAKSVIDSLPLFEKTAFDLCSLKSSTDIDLNYIQGAVNALDNTYKIACAIEASVDKNIKFV
ncbi:MAG: hypothetical protein ACRCX2_28115, partial [Paraclostridium sp.]